MKQESLTFLLDGKTTQAQPGETILQVARREGVPIPHLCYKDGLAPAGNCRACVVEIEGERVLAASCCRVPTPQMRVNTNNERVTRAQRGVLSLLLEKHVPVPTAQIEDELLAWGKKLGVAPAEPPSTTRLASPVSRRRVSDTTHPAIAVHLDACIRCTRCIRACRDTQVNDVLGMALRGDASTIVFDQGDPMGESSCVGCGECVQACPTGALSNKPLRPEAQGEAPAMAGVSSHRSPPESRTVRSVCPYCGVGCQLNYHVSGNTITHVTGANGPANAGRLCVKGRYGFDYVVSADRLTEPLLRITPKNPVFDRVPKDWRAHFRPVSWEQALEFAARGLLQAKRTYGAKALAGFGSAKGSNEEAYLFQKLVRVGFGSNNVDHCTRLCHASSVAALLEGIGSGAVSNPVRDVEFAEVIFLIGANPTVNHPVAATWIKNAVKRGATLILADPRRTELARHATYFLQFKPDTDVALLNAMLYTIVQEGLVHAQFVRERTENFEALKATVANYPPEAMQSVCGIPAATIREVARLFARSKASMVLWGMGVSQHIHGTDNARCLIALVLATGQIGKPGSGLHPLRGQNNVQGASDAGLIPMVFPDYQRVDDARARARFEALWNTSLDATPGLTVVETLQAIDAGTVKAMYIMGENPAMSDPDIRHTRASLAALEHLVVQDIFMTETAWLADVVLPASAWPEKEGTVTNTDRLIQLGRKAIDPPGNAKPDLWIINALARRLGLEWHYEHPRAVFEEMRKGMDSIAGISWERLERDGAAQYPCATEEAAGDRVVFVSDFPRPSKRARFVPADIIPAAERPDADYPFVLITGRQLEHWHTGAMTRRSAVLDALEPFATASMHPLDIAELCAVGTEPTQKVRVASRRGEITLAVRADAGTPRGCVFIPFAYAEAAANVLTNPALDPFGKIPEFKYCAVRVTPVS